MKESCENCKYWKQDFGIFTTTGWTGADKKDGHCHLEVKKVYKYGEDFCSHFTLKEE